LKAKIAEMNEKDLPRGTELPMNTHRRVMLPAMFAVCLLLSAVSALGQNCPGPRIQGTVSDHKGNPVPGVTVTVTSPDPVRPLAGNSDANGYYGISNIPPGTYTVTVEESEEFARFERAGIEVWLSPIPLVDIAPELKERKSRMTRKHTWIVFHFQSTGESYVENQVNRVCPDLHSHNGVRSSCEYRANGGRSTCE
jgi:hypothetical protein